MNIRRYLVLIVFLLSAGVASAERMAVNVPLANVRSGPGTEFKILWKLELNHPVEVLKTSGDWSRFQDYEGDKAWISLKLLSKTPTVIVKKNKCNVRSGPGTDNDIVFTVVKGVPFKVIERKGDWIRIEHSDGDRGWIYASLVW